MWFCLGKRPLQQYNNQVPKLWDSNCIIFKRFVNKLNYKWMLTIFYLNLIMCYWLHTLFNLLNEQKTYKINNYNNNSKWFKLHSLNNNKYNVHMIFVKLKMVHHNVLILMFAFWWIMVIFCKILIMLQKINIIKSIIAKTYIKQNIITNTSYFTYWATKLDSFVMHVHEWKLFTYDMFIFSKIYIINFDYSNRFIINFDYSWFFLKLLT